ncbi:hypothetical protein QJS66_02680 [Kocuria rhizophila]|nr:hypothetical protein QJS66_02680 [Kocuria rhizophila]
MYAFASHDVAGERERMATAIESIQNQLQERLQELESQKKLVEAQRLRMRTQHDLEMMEQMGYCNGIENYSLHITAVRGLHRLLDYFPDDFPPIIDESHATVPHTGGMYQGTLPRSAPWRTTASGCPPPWTTAR